MVQISHPYMTTGKTLALTIWTFVSKVMSLLFNMLYVFNVTADANQIRHVFVFPEKRAQVQLTSSQLESKLRNNFLFLSHGYPQYILLSLQGIPSFSYSCINNSNTCQLLIQIGTCHGHLQSTSTRIKLYAAVAADFQNPLKGAQGGQQK